MARCILYFLVLGIAGINVFASDGYKKLKKKHPELPDTNAHAIIMAGIYRNKIRQAESPPEVGMTRVSIPEEARVIFYKFQTVSQLLTDPEVVESLAEHELAPEHLKPWLELKEFKNDFRIFGGLKAFKEWGSWYMVLYFYKCPPLDVELQACFQDVGTGVKFAIQDQLTAAELTAEMFMQKRVNIKDLDYNLYDKDGLYVHARVGADEIATALKLGIQPLQEYINTGKFTCNKMCLPLKTMVNMASHGGFHVRQLGDGDFLLACWFSMPAVSPEVWENFKN